MKILPIFLGCLVLVACKSAPLEKKMTYTNPIILCDYSDPDVIRVGDTFYMTASSFNFMPGLPILTSTDLVNWTLVNYAVKRIPLTVYDTPQNAKGIWAPSIRYHDGMFYIFVATPDEGIMETHTTDPLGEWSELHFIWQGKGFEDPCPLWDDDGRVWLVHGYVKSRIGFNSKLGLLELDPKTMDAISEDKIIFDGTKTQPTIEGPKFYKRNGWYYIFAPAGGVTKGWQTELRSKKIDGDYEEKIMLVQGKSPTNGPHQGGWVQTAGGEDWFVHFQERGVFGRIVHLQPAVWKDDWLLLGTSVKTGKIPGEAVTEYAMPDVISRREYEQMGTDTNGENRTFSGPSLPGAPIVPGKNATRLSPYIDMQWQWSANVDDAFADFNADGSIALHVLDTRAKKNDKLPFLWDSANVLTQKIQHEYFDVVATVDASNVPVGARTGIVFLGKTYASVAVEHNADGFALVYFEADGDGDVVRSEFVKDRLLLTAEDARAVQFKLHFEKKDERTGIVTFSAETSANGSAQVKWTPSAAPFVAEKAHWVGGRFGIYAVGKDGGKAVYSSIVITSSRT